MPVIKNRISLALNVE